MFQVPNHDDAEKIVRDADPHITAAAEAIKDNIAFPKTKNNMVYRLMSSAVNPVFYPLFVSAKKFTADSRCGAGTVHTAWHVFATVRRRQSSTAAKAWESQDIISIFSIQNKMRTENYGQSRNKKFSENKKNFVTFCASVRSILCKG